MLKPSIPQQKSTSLYLTTGDISTSEEQQFEWLSDLAAKVARAPSDVFSTIQ